MRKCPTAPARVALVMLLLTAPGALRAQQAPAPADATQAAAPAASTPATVAPAAVVEPNANAVPASPEQVVEPVAQDNTVITPDQGARNAVDAAEADGKAPGYTLSGPALLFITAIVAIGAWLMLRKIKNSLGSRLTQTARGAIEICRTRSLGGKQHLVVVQVEGKRLLLGVGPGFITNLTELEPEDYSIPFERKEKPVTPEPAAPRNANEPTPFSNLINRINDSLGTSGRDDNKPGPKAR